MQGETERGERRQRLGTGFVVKTIDFKLCQRFGVGSQITQHPACTDGVLPFQAVIEI